MARDREKRSTNQAQGMLKLIRLFFFLFISADLISEEEPNNVHEAMKSKE